MYPPNWALPDTCLLQARTLTLNLAGEQVETWVNEITLRRCGVFPATVRGIQRAQLLGVTITKEVFMLGKVQVSPVDNRLKVAGQTYRVNTSSDWDSFTVLGVEDIKGVLPE